MVTINCIRCNAANAEGANYCKNCGFSLGAETEEYLVCISCGEGYPQGTKFCPRDGGKLINPSTLIPRCVKCGTEYIDGTKYCPLDGGVVIAEALRTNYSQSYYSPRPVNTYPKASIGTRFLASLIDGIITTALAIPAIGFFVFGLEQTRSYYGSKDDAVLLMGLALLLSIFPLGYSLIKDGLGNGQSYGKRAMDLMVVDLENNLPCSKKKSALRNLVSGLVGIIPFVGGFIEPIMVLAQAEGRKLGDKALNTQVIEKMHYLKEIH